MPYAKKSSSKDVREFMSDMQDVTSIPGGVELLLSQVMESKGGEGGRKLRLYNRGGPVEYAGGGLHMAAEAVRDGGRGDDEVLLHVSPEEYDALVAMWGEPDINPMTGLPEYGFLSKIWKKVKKAVKKIVKSPLFSFLAPMALNVFAPGLGAAIGKTLGFAGKTASTVGNTLVRAGIGAASGGKEGALSGAVSGLTGAGAGKDLGTKLGLEGTTAKLAGDAIIGGVGGEIGGGGFTQGALGNVMNAMQMDAIKPMTEKFEGGLRKIFKPEDMVGGPMSPVETLDAGDLFGMPPSAPDGPMSPIPGGAPSLTPDQPGVLGRAWDWIRENPLLAAGAGTALYGMARSGSGNDARPPELPPEFLESIPSYDFTRDRGQIDPNAYYTYGQVGAPQQGEATFFTNNYIGERSNLGDPNHIVGVDVPSSVARLMQMNLSGATGPYGNLFQRLQQQVDDRLESQSRTPATPIPNMEGELPQMLAQLRQRSGAQFAGGGYAEGLGSGRDDTIEALLSDGEYVMDAETVAMLGDGSNKEGARRLDEMREELRRHKGSKLKDGKFSPDAKRPADYLKTKRKKRRKKAKGGAMRRKKLVKRMAAEAALGD